MTRRLAVLGSVLVALAAAGPAVAAQGIHKIKHVVIIMQENRSFDNYFGTYPGADGIPMRHGVPTACIPDPYASRARPYHDSQDVNDGGPHDQIAYTVDYDNGRMDGFIRAPGECMPRTRCRPPGLRREPVARHDGLPQPARDPELLGLRARLRAPGPHVRAERVVEPARAPVHGLGMVGARASRPEIRSAASRTSRFRGCRPTSARPTTAPRPTTRGPTSPTCCTSTT